MADFSKLAKFTEAAFKMIAESNTSEQPLIFTTMALGDGALSKVPARPETITELVAKQVEFPVTSKYAVTDETGTIEKGSYVVEGPVTGITNAFVTKELGLYAKVGTNGTPKLFLYARADGAEDYVSNNDDTRIMSITVVTGNASSVNVNVTDGTYATVRMLDEKAKEITTAISNSLSVHNADAAAHKPILDAIKAITGLDFGTAPSRTITNMITLLGQGGIIAARLSETGFVKFANGFTIQWGTTVKPSNNGVKASLSIAFTELFVVVCTGIVDSNEPNYKLSGSWIWDLSTTTELWFRTNVVDAPALKYIAIGKV